MSAGICLLIVSLLGQAAAADADLEAPYGRLIEGLMCACKSENWTRTLKSCTDACADPQKKEIRALLSEGKSEEEVVDLYVARYGPKVVAGTPFEGIHILVYLAPPLIIILGAIGILAFVRRRVSRPGTDSPAPLEDDDPYARRVDAELEEM